MAGACIVSKHHREKQWSQLKANVLTHSPRFLSASSHSYLTVRSLRWERFELFSLETISVWSRHRTLKHFFPCHLSTANQEIAVCLHCADYTFQLVSFTCLCRMQAFHRAIFLLFLVGTWKGDFWICVNMRARSQRWERSRGRDSHAATKPDNIYILNKLCTHLELFVFVSVQFGHYSRLSVWSTVPDPNTVQTQQREPRHVSLQR